MTDEKTEFLIDYWKMNVRQYAKKENVTNQIAALDLNRQLTDITHQFSADFIERQNKIQERWFRINGAIMGAIALALVQIIIKAIWEV